jgi:hypothetical protein
VRSNIFLGHMNLRPIDRDVLVLPDVMVEDFGGDPSQIMRPLFDMIWNASGLERSLNYDDEGNWRIDTR